MRLDKGQIEHDYVHYNGVSLFNIKWKNNNVDSGYVQHTYTRPGLTLRDITFLSDDIAGLSDGTKSFDEYPELEITVQVEFKGMLIEHHLKPDPNNPVFLMSEVVYTSTILSGN